MANVPITPGTGAVSVASESVSGVYFQQIEVVGKGGASVMSVNPDGSINASIAGKVTTQGSVQVMLAQQGDTTSGQDSTSYYNTYTTNGSFNNPAFGVAGHVFNGSNWDRARGNSSIGTLVSTGASSVITTQLAGSILSVSEIQPAGSVMAVRMDSASVIAVAKGGSVMTVAALAGSVTAMRTDNASVITTQPAGSVLAVSGTFTTPAGSVQSVTTPAGSVIAVRTDSASVITVPQISSIITIFTNPSIIAAAPRASIVQGTADLRVVLGASVAALSAPGSNIRNYVTAVQVSNFGPSSVLVTIADNTTSVLGWTIAPAGGGSNFNPMYKAAANSPVTASISGTASVLVSMQGYTAS